MPVVRGCPSEAIISLIFVYPLDLLGSAKGFIQIANALESWDTKLNSILNGGAMPIDGEWMRLYELFSDWLVTIEETAECVGSTQKEELKAAGKPHEQ